MPQPTVWTLFAGIDAAILVFGFLGCIYGFAKHQLGQPSNAIFALPVMMVMLGLVDAAAQLGQRLGPAQMKERIALLHRVRDSSDGYGGHDPQGPSPVNTENRD